MPIGERHDGILTAACDAIARRGFHQASIQDIARVAALSLAALYHYVGGKDELPFLVLDPSLASLDHKKMTAGVRWGARESRP